MSITTYHFREIGSHPKKSGKCPACGKRATRSKYIYQTVNPFNRNAEGSTKTVPEILAENRAKGDEWIALPVYHARCES